MKFVTLFPEVENVHLIKSCGMVPYMLYKYHGFDSTIVGYKNSNEYPYLDKEVKGLKLEFLKKIFNNKTLDSCVYLIINSKKIDVLHLYHMTPRSFYCALIYKIFNSKGLVYLKTDNSQTNLFDKPLIKKKMKLFAIRIFDIISSESEFACRYFNQEFATNFHYIQNGFYDYGVRKELEEKENVILTVARIGDPEKANDLMLNGFAEASKVLKDWRLRLVGNINEEFKEFISDYFKKYPELKGRVELVGEIKDREVLNKEYQKSKIFALTSISEGFPTVFLEAIKSGCYIVTSNIGGSEEITQQGKLGTIFETGSTEGFARALIEASINQNETIAREIQDYAYDRYYWPKTIAKLNERIYKKQKT